MSFTFSPKQLRELDRAARTHPDAHVRSRAMAIRAVALGHTRREVAALFPFSSYSVGQAVLRYRDGGIEALAVAAGRGRRSAVDDEEVRTYLRQSPERFGYDRNRWTLALLAEACPTLRGMSESGVLQVLHRLGFRYKRGQPWIHSPDPRYEEKKTPSRRPTKKRAATPRG